MQFSLTVVTMALAARRFSLLCEKQLVLGFRVA